MFRSQNIRNGRLDLTERSYTDEKHFLDRVRRAEPTSGDLIITREAPMGEVCLIPEGVQGCLGQRMVLLRPEPSECDAHYLLYALLSPQVQNEISAHDGTGTTVSNLRIPHLEKLPIPYQPLATQKEIAAVLKALDDKIELNRQMNRTLEETAGALYRSWFVDFDPVVAKAAGRPPAHLSPALAALFPASFQDSDLGPIPKGWRVGRLDEVLVLQRGFDLPAGSRTAGPYPIIAASGLNGTHHEFKVKGPGVTTGRSGVLGKVYYVEEDFWPLNTSLWIKEYLLGSPLHAYYLLQGMEIETYNAGSAVPTLNRNHVHNLPVVIPPPALVQAFEAQARPLFQMRHHNQAESQTLAALRDTLLPKLLSGEVRVKLESSL